MKAFKTAFCARCMKETKHELSIQGKDNDIVLTCTEAIDEEGTACGQFIKAPAGLEKTGLEKLLAEHKANNDRPVDRTPQLSEEEKEFSLGELADETEEEATEEA